MGEFGSSHCGTKEGKKNYGKKRTEEKKNSFIRFEVLRGKKKKKKEEGELSVECSGLKC